MDGERVIVQYPARFLVRFGILANLRHGGAEGLWGAFIQGLQELGYAEGRNVVMEWQGSEGRYERLPDLAAELDDPDRHGLSG